MGSEGHEPNVRRVGEILREVSGSGNWRIKQRLHPGMEELDMLSLEMCSTGLGIRTEKGI